MYHATRITLHQLARCPLCGWEVLENIATYEDGRWTSQSLVPMHQLAKRASSDPSLRKT